MTKLEDIKKYSDWKSSWNNPNEMDLFSYISFNCHPEDLLIIGNLFFPSFIEFENGLFFAEKFSPKNYLEWHSKMQGDITSIEKIINHMHIYDLFGNCSSSISDETFEEVAKMLQFAWKLKLKTEYPGRTVMVDYEFTEQDYGPTLTIYQPR